MSTDFKNIPIKEIHPDPKQPRKFFDESAMQEFIESVREKGVLQPIIVRPNGKGYMLVCGERRFKAATAVQVAIKDRDTIPAVIRELSDDEALELQIIENLQRKDVHPMEEAVAFKSLLENKERPLTVEQVAAKVAKTPYFVKQRIKLNSLTEDWQKVFYANKIHVSDALEISTLAVNEQGILLKSSVDKRMLSNPQYEVHISDHSISQLRRKLKQASFDTKDDKLVPGVCACTVCPFNSAVAVLFPEDAKDPICNNAACFIKKSSAAFDAKLKDVLDNPDVILISGYVHDKEDKDLISRLEKDKHKIYSTSYDGDVVVEDTWSYKESKAVPVKGFHLTGHEKGKLVNVKIKVSRSSNQTKEKAKAGNLTADDIDIEIKRIQEREKRSLELDGERIHAATLNALTGHNVFKKPGIKLQAIDRGIMIYLLLELSGMIHDTLPGVPKPPSGKEYKHEYFQKLSKLTDDVLAFIIRAVAYDKFGSRNLQYGMATEDTTMRLIAEYAGIDLKAIEKAQEEAAAKRKGNVERKLAKLRKDKLELKRATAKPAAKKAAKKKSAKK